MSGHVSGVYISPAPTALSKRLILYSLSQSCSESCPDVIVSLMLCKYCKEQKTENTAGSRD